MQSRRSVMHAIKETVYNNKWLSFTLVLAIAGTIGAVLLPPLVLEQIVNRLAEHENVGLSIAIGYFLLVAVSGFLEALKESVITVFGQKVTHRIRSAMSEKLLRLPASYYIEKEPGVTASRFVNDVNTVENLFTSGVISMASNVCKLVSIVLIIFSRSKGLGIILVVVTPFLFWMTRVFQKRMLKAQIESRVAVGRTNQLIPETLKNMRTIRVLRRQEFMQQRYGDTIEQGFRAQEQSNFCDAIYSPIIVTVSALLIGVMMGASGQAGAIREFFGMSAGTAAALIAYVGNFFEPLENIGMEIQNIQSAAAGVRRINEFFDEKEEPYVSKLYGVKDADPCVTKSSKQDNQKSSAVKFSEVCFSYGTDQQEILHDFNMEIKEGENVVLTGRTGAGKSTLIKLISGLYRPDKGKIMVYGIAPSSIPEEKRRHLFGYVEQQFRMIRGTVAEQISLKDPEVSERQIEKALETVGILNTVCALPDKMDTQCDEKLFSQGQFQLLSIARAIVLNPKILLLDEITANLDSGTEEQIMNALKNVSHNRTVISISHRLYNKSREREIVIG